MPHQGRPGRAGTDARALRGLWTCRPSSPQRGGPLDEVRERLAGQISVLVGHSGVGKSTLINALVPAAERATGAVSAIGKGRHTSTSAVALPCRRGGWVIDTPGLRSFGLAHVTADDLLWAFPDLEDGADQCPPGCEHLCGDAGLHAGRLGGGGALDAGAARRVPAAAGEQVRR